MAEFDRNASPARSLAELLDLRAGERPQAAGFYFVQAGNADITATTYGELRSRARAVAGVLRSYKGRRERALLLYPAGLEFIVALFACLYEGVIAVPVSLPHPRRIQVLEGIIRDSGASLVLSTTSLASSLQPPMKQLGCSPLCWIETDAIHGAAEYQPLPGNSDALAYLQYTSGSTSQPRGVEITHANLLANCADIAAAFPSDSRSVQVSWLPHFHDMGLVTGIFTPLFSNYPAVLIAPADFVQRPTIWLEMITRFRGTHSASPNFGYQLCIDKIPDAQSAALDLTSWQYAACSAEPVRFSTVNRFAEIFGAYGFNRLAFRSAYGLAEATLMVTCSPPGLPLTASRFEREALSRGAALESETESATTLVSSGKPQPGTKIKIVNPDTGMERNAGAVGEIWVSGPGVASGYWNNIEKTEQLFGRALREEQRFLRTGDMGFCWNDELFITGRLKDTIIVCGRNHYAADLEEVAAQSHDALGSAAGAAFAVELDGEEHLVIVQEIERTRRREANLDEILKAIVRETADACGVEPYAVLLVKPGSIPKTSSGKVKRYACRELYLKKEIQCLKEWVTTSSTIKVLDFPKIENRSAAALQEWLVAAVAAAKKLDRGEIDPDQPFASFGFGSSDSIGFSAELERVLGIRLPPTLLYECPTPASLSLYLASRFLPSESRPVIYSGVSSDAAVAIIGIGCRFPEAGNVHEFWKLLCDGRDAVVPMPEDRHHLCGLNSSISGGFIRDIDRFDAAFFRISPREAELMDPQQRVLLETVWHALEDAGIVPDHLASKKVGVFVGIGNNEYGNMLLASGSPAETFAATGNSSSIAANRISYTFDFRGPSISIDSACSSSLAALHLAMRALQGGECELALVSGVNLLLTSSVYENLAPSGMLSPDFRCKVFDASANGYVRSEGVGAVVLKPLAKALEDNDRIYCVISGSAVNHNGRSNGMLAPSREAQVAVLREAWHDAGISPDQLQYVETHSTGSLLGDAVELSALTEALAGRQDKCWIGSVKTNIGHLESAAGMAGLIKTALAIHHGVIPRNLHLEQLSPNAAWRDLPIDAVRSKTTWSQANPRIAGVSTSSFGGANAHVVLREPPSAARPLPGNSSLEKPWLLPISARTPHSLQLLARSYAELLSSNETASLKEICISAATMRAHHSHRIAILAESRSQAAEFCIREAEKVAARSPASTLFFKPLFIFDVCAAPRPEAGLELLALEPSFRRALEECDILLHANGAPAVIEILQSGTGFPADTAFDCAQLSIFLMQIGLVAIWRGLGILPSAVMGHGIGEIAAAFAAGALSLKDAARIAIVHARLSTKAGREGVVQESLYHKFVAGLEGIQPAATAIPIHSSAVGFVESCASLNAEYWWKSLNNAHPFAPDLRQMKAKGFNLCLKLSGEPVIAGNTSDLPALDRELEIVPSFQGDVANRASLLQSLGTLYRAGATVNWRALFSEKLPYTALPLYPFESKRYWIKSSMHKPARVSENIPSQGAKKVRAYTAVEEEIIVRPSALKIYPKDEILKDVINVLAKLLYCDPAEVNPQVPLLEMGAESIIIMAAARQLHSHFNVEIDIRKMIGPRSSASELAEYIYGQMLEDCEAHQNPRVQSATGANEARAVYPLSGMQKGFWFFQQLARQSSAYNIPGAIEIVGSLDFSALSNAVRRLIQRHPALRTTFHAGDNGEPFQVVHEQPFAALELVQAEGWTEDFLEQQIAHAGWADFNLEQSIFRAVVFRWSDQRNILLLSIHHLVADLWSFAIIFRELAQFYSGEIEQSETEALPPNFTFRDYVYREQELISKKEDVLWEYWRSTLAALPEMDLPTDRLRPAVQTYAAGEEPILLGQELTASLMEMSAAQGCTSFMVLLASLAVLLHRYTGQNDILIGSPVSVRSAVDWSSVVGCFINMLPLRLQVEPSASFHQVLSGVRTSVLEALEHREYPLPLLIERLKPVRDLSRPPLISTAFMFYRTPGPDERIISSNAAGESGVSGEFGPATFRTRTIINAQMPYELDFIAANGQSGLIATVRYNKQLFDDSTGARIAGHWRELLSGIVHAPHRPVASLSFLTQAEKDQLKHWNATEEHYSREKLVHELFEIQVRKSPDVIAIQDSSRSLTYRELDVEADRQAAQLRALGIGPEAIAGVCLERSLNIAIALLAILKAGGAYLPLDPTLPETRLQFMLRDSGALVIVTEKTLVSRFQGNRLLLMETAAAGGLACMPENRPRACDSKNLAYLIYTSGSTGQPKGVQITHQSVVNFLTSLSANPGLCAGDVLLSVTTISFDIFGLELYLPLVVGAKVVIAPREACLDGQVLIGWLNETNATVMQATPATWQLLLSAKSKKFPAVKVLVGGDALPWSLTQELLSFGCSVWNLYGPTETTIWSTIYSPQTGSETASWVPVGSAIGNTEVHILDGNLDRCPVGIAGEIYIGGEGLARGYWKRPDLTAERFLPDPYSATAGRQFYRTGDLGRRRSDGIIEFLGRNDQQIKIRGFRIELGEIEATLRLHPGIADCAVAVHENAHGGKRLIAYLVAIVSNREPGTAELRTHLRACLPEHMVPADFVFLDQLPHTPNGKLDRKALGGFRVVPSAESHAAPQSELEQAIGKIWETVLGVEKIGLDDNFFDMGGHSLLLTQVQSRLRQLNHQVSILDLFRFPTVRALAAFVSTCQEAGSEIYDTIHPTPRVPAIALPLSFAQRRLWLINEIEPENKAYNLIGGVRILGHVDLAALQSALVRLIERHESLRTVFDLVEGTAVQRVLSPSPIELELNDQSYKPEMEWDDSVREAAQSCSYPFNLRTGPLCRLKLLKFSETSYVLVVCLHHIIADGWSLGLFLSDLGALYGASVTGVPATLPSLTIQFADFAVWQRQKWDSGMLQSQIDYWLNELNGVPSFLNLPSDFPRLEAPGFAGHHEPFELEESTSTALRQLCRDENATPFMLLLAAFSLLLARYSGQDDFVIGTDIANRNHPAIENLIGCFVNLLPLRMQLNADLSFREYLGRVKCQALAAFANQDVPFDHLVRMLRPERKMTNTPLVQVLFVLQNAPLESIEAANIRLEPLPIPMTTAEFELILSMRELGGVFTGTLAHSRDLFSPPKAKVILKHFQTLLDHVVRQPDKLLSAFSLSDDAGRLKHLVDRQSDLDLNQKDLDNLYMQIDTS